MCQLSSVLVIMIYGMDTGNVAVTQDFDSHCLIVLLVSQGLTFHLLAQVGAPAVPHVLHCQQVPLCVMDQQ